MALFPSTTHSNKLGGQRNLIAYSECGTDIVCSKIEVEFKIHGAGNLHGDGMAIWLTKERATTGVVFGSTDHFNGLGVFIDTYKNQRPGIVFPYVMAMMGNGTVSYDKEHDGKDNEIAGCSVRFPFLITKGPPFQSSFSKKEKNLLTDTL